MRLVFFYALVQGMKDKEKHKYPMLTQENKELADSIADTVIGCVIRGRNSFLKTAQEIVSLNRQWKDQSTYVIYTIYIYSQTSLSQT